VVDVRTPHEREEGAIPGSLFVPLSQLEHRLEEIPRGRPLIVHCAAGYRSSVAASVLKREGFEDVAEIAGGMAAWQAAGLPVAAS
jgi:rhodanese-related sulfurtransferase